MTKLIRRKEAALILGVPVGTLDQWRFRKQGPPWVSLGRVVAYSEKSLQEWIDKNTHRAEAGAAS